jgi:tetratricopeptide (TPR) repeat protein
VNGHVEGPKYWAFISYSHSDARWADWLHKVLESYRPPKQLVGTITACGAVPKRLTPIFRDREELASATDLGAVITAALVESASQIVICSPHAAKSRWVNEEILAFKRLGREDRIFCLIVEGEPNASEDPQRADEECFPPALRFHLGPDGALGSTRTEPIAADARPGKDGKNNGKLKLIAGILGVGYDLLRRREQQRRHRRLFALACGATAGMVITSGLAAYALVERSAAERQTARAEAEAETAKQTTKFLVDLFRISDPSEARGNSVTAREMLDKGAAHIDQDLATQPRIQATLLDTVGTVYTGLGLYREARPLLDRAVATQRRLQGADPLDLSAILTHLGYLTTVQADYASAEAVYREALAIQAAQPDSQQNKMARATTLYDLGVMLAQQGRFPDAEAAFRQALELQRALYGDRNGDVARTLKYLARVIAEGGNLKEAIPLMQSAVAMQRELRGKEPHPDLAEAINDLGYLFESSGDYDGAEKCYREAIAMNSILLGEKHPAIALALNNLAFVIQSKGDLPRAEATYRLALEMERGLLGEVHPEVANTLNNIAFVQYDRGDTRGALATERESLAVYRKLFPGDYPEVAGVMNRIGFWLTQAGQYGEAERDLRAALDMRQRLFGDTHPDVAGSLTHIAFLQVATHRYAEALSSSRRATQIFTTAFSPTHWKTAAAETAQGAALAGLGKLQEALQLLTRCSAILEKDGGAPAVYAALARRYLEDLRRRSPSSP